MAQSIGTQDIDVEKNEHACSISAHKIYGPKGIGALYLSNNIKNTLRPLISGGGQEKNLRSGTLSPALCVGIGGLARLDTEQKKIYSTFQKLKSFLLSELIKSKLDFDINGDVQKRIPNLNISIRNTVAEQLFNFMPQYSFIKWKCLYIGHYRKISCFKSNET